VHNLNGHSSDLVFAADYLDKCVHLLREVQAHGVECSAEQRLERAASWHEHL
jgi:hypothetical protein